MRKILVTGATGFFASRLIASDKNMYQIAGLDHQAMDITDENAVNRIFENEHPTYVVHSAALSDTGYCREHADLSYLVNVKGTRNIAKSCSKYQAKLIYLSSDQVYNGNTEPGPYTEDDAVPDTVYGRHKFEAETAIQEISDESVILRLTWMFSLPEKNKKINGNIVWNLMRALLKNEPVRLSANEFRGMTYVYDLVKNLDRILELPGGVYNAGSENEKSTYETARTILEQLGLYHRIEDLLMKDDARDYRDLRICNQKLRQHGVVFPDTTNGIAACLSDFSLV